VRFSALVPAALLFFSSLANVQAGDDLRIDSPATGSTVSGTVEILGTAAIAGMARYRVEFAYDPNPTATWFLIAENTAPVQNGILAVWDTARVSQGVYALRVAVVLPDGTVRDTVTSGIRIRRKEGAAPTPSEESVVPVGTYPPVEGRAAAAFPAPTAVVESGSSQTTRSASPMGIAFLSGGFLALLGFALYWIRSHWQRWRHQRLVRGIRRGGS
jgi:hypothetical protein